MKCFFRAAVAFLSACLLVLLPPLTVSSHTPALSAHSAVLLDAYEGRVLFEVNAHKKMGMASTTKIMTALLVAEELPLDRIITVPTEAVGVEGSSVYLCSGEQLTVRQLLYAMLLSSANDAATALAIAHSGSVESFAQRMNNRAAAMGLKSTSFENPHGLDGKNHYTTAYELALIAAEALKNEELATIFATKRTTIPQGITPQAPNGEGERYLVNHNKLLWRYEGAIGVKTGFTRANGRCLVSAAERDGLRLVAVTLSDPDDWNDHTALLDMGFAQYCRVQLYGVGEFKYSLPICGGRESYVTLVNSLPVVITLRQGEAVPAVSVEAPHRFELAPVEKHRALAELVLRHGGKEVRSPLLTLYGVEKQK